jgi:type II secretory pathway component GspD/PulD (secretin)
MVKNLIVCFIVFLFLGAANADNLIKKVDFDDAAVLDVVQILAKKANLGLVVSGDGGLAQNKRTSLHLNNISAEEAIDHVLRTNGMAYEKKGEVILVSASPQANANFNQGVTEAVSLKYLTAERISSLLGKLLPALKSSVGGSANSIVLQGNSRLIKEAKKLILSIDKPVPQILIESKVLEVSESASLRLGISYGRDAGIFKFVTDMDDGKTEPAEDLQTVVQALISEGKAKVVASPKIATLDDHQAVINIGSRIPYAVPVSNGSNSTQWTVEYIDAGVKLLITPRLGEEGFITTSIQPEVSSVSEWRSTAAGDFPVITTRNAQATLRVKNGETIVVGGLLSESDRENVSKLPILGDLPIAGPLFQNRTLEKTKTEIVFLITPHVI